MAVERKMGRTCMDCQKNTLVLVVDPPNPPRVECKTEGCWTGTLKDYMQALRQSILERE